MPLLPDDPASLSSAPRRQEIAAILGWGLHRFLAGRKLAEACDSAPDLADKALDVSAPRDPHVSWLAKPRT